MAGRATALRAVAFVAALVSLAACGGGSRSGGTPPANDPPSGGSSAFAPGIFKPSSTFAGQCVSPRPGTSDLPGSRTDENNFLRSWTNELYLWYDEVPDIDPATLATPDYFDRLKTPQRTASGHPKDPFHFTYDTAEWRALSQSGVEIGYGAQWIIIPGPPPNGTPRRVVVAYVEPDSPASAPGVDLHRGAELLRADGVDASLGSTAEQIDTLDAATFPTTAGETHELVIRDSINATPRTIRLTSAAVTSIPVPTVTTLPTPSGLVGYILFNDHVATSEPALVEAVKKLRDENIQDLVLDIRYNGGGYLDIASELAYMIGGATTAGHTFERLVFNDKHPDTNPVTGQALLPTPFHTTTQILEPTGQPLPTLNLPHPRVYVLTGKNTCSASEAIINGLRGVDVEVYQIGSTTCGKPYGFYPQDNCGTTYFSIQFQGVNEKDFGDYADGFSPPSADDPGVPLPGCSVADDFEHALGDPLEARLAAALFLRESGNQNCPLPAELGPNVFSKPGQRLSAPDGVMYKSPWRENRIMRVPRS